MQLLFLAFALLVCDTAAGLACGLAGSLAFAAAAVLLACAEIAGLDGLDVFHNIHLQIKYRSNYSIFSSASQYMRERFSFFMAIFSSDFFRRTKLHLTYLE